MNKGTKVLAASKRTSGKMKRSKITARKQRIRYNKSMAKKLGWSMDWRG